MKYTKECNSCGRVYKTENDFLTGTSRWRVCTLGHLWFNCACDSTLILKKDQYSWYSPTLAMRDDGRGVFGKLAKKQQLPNIKHSILLLQELMSRRELEIEVVVKALRKAPLLAGEILSMANRMKAARDEGTAIENLQHAVIYIGMKRLKDMILTMSLKELEVNTEVFSPVEFWEGAFVQALVLEFLAERYTPYHNPEELYLAGYLMNVGKIVSAYFHPERVDKIYKAYQSPKNTYSWLDLEKIYQADSYLIMGEIACALWGMPETILECSSNHHSLSSSNSKMISKTDLAVFANQMTNWINYKLTDVDQPILDQLGKRLGILPADLEKVAYEISDYVNKSKSVGSVA